MKQQKREFTKLTYTEFLKKVLDFQLQEHENFLKKFTLCFKSVDHDRNGTINEDEFRELMQLMGVIQKKDDITYLLNIVDTYRH